MSNNNSHSLKDSSQSSQNNCQLSIVNCPLYERAHTLLYLGEDGSPIYADEFRRLNDEVIQLIGASYPIKGSSPKEEAEICLALLMGFSAVIYTVEDQEVKIQSVLDRAFVVLRKLDASLLKCQLLLYCYTEVREKELVDEAKDIIISWGGRELIKEEKEAMGMYNGLIVG